MALWPFENFWAHFAVFTILIIAFILLMVMVFIWFERRAFGPFQMRWGPNRASPWGALQPVADAIKVLLKEDIVPAVADKWVHFLAPIVGFLPVLLIFAVIPLHNGYGLIPDLNIGILYVVAISALSVVGVFMAGWGSGNKFSLLGGMRVVAQMVSYEVPLVLSILSVVLVAGSLSLNDIVGAQSIPFFVLMPLGFLIFLVAAMAEINRGPFDLLEADSELVAGFHTEYSGMKFAMFYLAEYGHALAMSAIAATLFFGGWKGPGGEYVGILWFLLKIFFVFSLLIWFRTTFPRLRVDQLMSFGWKFLFPLSLINLFIVAGQVILWGEIPWWAIFINFPVAIALIYLWSRLFKLGGGRVEVRA